MSQPKPLSYAERAKKAQNIRSAIAAPPPQHQRPPVPQQPLPDTPSASTATSSIGDTPNSSIVLPTRSSSPTPAAAAANVEQSWPQNGSPPSLAVKALSIVEAHTSPPKPIANVWKERMAAARASTSSQKPPTSAVAISPTSKTAASNPPPSAASRSVPGLKSPTLNGNQTGKMKRTSTAIADTDDPFVVQVPDHLVAPAPLGADPENWPQVGKSQSSLAASPSASSTSQLALDGNKQPSVSGTPRKGEKTKWVLIPPEELLAAADAASSSNKSRSQSRKSSRNHQTLQPSQSHSNISNPHTRSPQSGRTSASHSASHSRSASVQSSPKVPRGRRLPPEELPSVSGESVGGRNYPGRSSNTAPLLPKTAEQTPPDLEPSSSSTATATYPQPPYLSTHTSAFQPTGGHHTQHHQSTPFHASAPIFYPQNVNASGSGASSPPHPQLLPPISTFSPPPLGPYPPYQKYSPYGSASGEYPSGGPYSQPGAYMPWVPQGHGPLSGHQSPIYPPPMHQMHGPLHQHYMPPPNPGLNGFHAPPMNGSISGTGSGAHTPPVSVEGPSSLAGARFSPQPPGDSDPVASYKDTPGSQPREGGSGAASLVFGSIKMSGSIVPSSAPVAGSTSGPASVKDTGVKEESGIAGSEEADKEKTFIPSLAIGVDATEAVPARLKSRARDGKEKENPGSSPIAESSTSRPSFIQPQTEVKWKFGTASSTPPPSARANVNGKPSSVYPPPPNSASYPHIQVGEYSSVSLQQRQHLPSSVTMPSIPVGMGVEQPHVNGFQLDPRGSTSFHMPPQRLSRPPSTATSTPSTMPSPSLNTSQASADPDLEVKDYGYGFGDASGLGYAPMLAKERQREWEREREMRAAMWQAQAEGQGVSPIMGLIGLIGGGGEGAVDTPKDVEPLSPSIAKDQAPVYPGGGRGRRGAGGSGGPSVQPGGRGGHSNGFASDRGSYGDGGRRGLPRGFKSARGGGRGGRGMVSAQRSPPFTVTPPLHFQPLPHDLSSGAAPPVYYPGPHALPPRQQAYMATGYEGYPSPGPPPSSMQTHHMATQMGPPQLSSVMPPPPPQLNPPVPVPLSTISFPLDPTRYYLLGQLEYYLSPQNLAQDFFLRQKMDERGWIPITLIASFNRVKQLTMDVQLVRDVLTLSSLVQVRGNMVRMGGWERYVLPDAAPSTVEEQPLPYLYQNLAPYWDDARIHGPGDVVQPQGQDGGYSMPQPPDSGLNEGQMVGLGQKIGVPLANGDVGPGHEDEDEEDDVVFVMGHEVGTWSPERRA